MAFLRGRSSGSASEEPPKLPGPAQVLPAEEEPLLHTLRIALNLQMRESSTETYTQADSLIAALQNVLAHGFKSKQFFVFKVRVTPLASPSAAPPSCVDVPIRRAGAALVACRGLGEAEWGGFKRHQACPQDGHL